jgi:hypothetical protein
MPTLPLLWLGALISGIGVACFHPEAARFANYVSGAKKASGMRWFAAGGNVGFATGPIVRDRGVAAFGLPGTLAAAIPVARRSERSCCSSSAVCARSSPRTRRRAPDKAPTTGRRSASSRRS